MTVPAATMPDSTYGLLASAARAWPDTVAAQWIPDPAAVSVAGADPGQVRSALAGLPLTVRAASRRCDPSGGTEQPR